MSSSQVRTFNDKRPLILLSFSFYSQKALTLTISSQVGDLLYGLHILLHCPALPSTSWGDVTLCAVVALLTTIALMLRCLRRSFHFLMSTCLLLFILELNRQGDQHHDLISQAHPLHVSSSPPAAPPGGAVRQALLLPPLDVLGRG